MEFAIAPMEAWDQMPMRVPIAGSKQQSPAPQQLQLTQQQLQLQQQLLNQQNQQHLQQLLLQQQLLQQGQQMPLQGQNNLQQGLQGQGQTNLQSLQAQQLPALLGNRTVIDPTMAYSVCKAPIFPGMAGISSIPGVPAVCPWIWPVDPCIIGAGVMPGWGPMSSLPFISGTGTTPGVSVMPSLGIDSSMTGPSPGDHPVTSTVSPDVFAGQTVPAKRRSIRVKGRKDSGADGVVSVGPMAAGELVGGPVMAEVLAEVRKDGAKSHVLLREALPHVVELARDAEGSRFLQAKLETANTAERKDVFEALLPEVTALAADASGSAVVQKLLDICTPEQRKAIVESFKGEVLKLSIKMYGCRVIQKAFQVCPPDLQTLLAGELKNGITDCIKSMHGNHVVQKCIEQMPPDSVSFVVDAIEGRAEQMAAHIYGCRIIQRLLEHCAPKRLEKMLDQILRSIIKLATDPYGNYVIRHILEHGRQEHKRIIIEKVCGNVLELGRDKHASNVVEKCFEASTTGEHATSLKGERNALIRAVLGDPCDPEHGPLLQLLDDRYGKYVVQSLVDYSRGLEEIKVLYSRISATTPQKKSSQNRSSILEQLEKHLQQSQLQQQQFVQQQLQQLQQLQQ